MTKISNKTIAVIGGGPGGLTLARLLQMRGLSVKVYERDAGRTARVQGATLDLHEDAGLLALRHANLLEEFWAKYRPGADKLVILDRNADVLLSEFSSTDHGEERPEIDRGPLRSLLLDSLQEDTVVWGCQLTGLTRLEHGIQLDFANGESALADIVVGAEGANSKIRPYVTSVKPVYSGVTVVEGSVDNAASATPRIHQIVGIGKIFAMGDEKSLIVSAKGDGSLAFYTGQKVPEFWARDCGVDFSDNNDVLRWFREEFHGWGDIWEELFRNASAAFTPRPQYYLPQDTPWETQPDLTLLGDAAHVMPPYAGEGVNMAMLDALDLAECLTSEDFSDTRAAIGAYEARMRSRVTLSMQMTLEQTAAFHAPNALDELVKLFQEHAAAG